MIAAMAIFAGLWLSAGLHAGAQTPPDTKALAEIMAIATSRYEGDITAAEVKPGKEEEETPLVYELRMVTRAGNVLRIRIDAVSGEFLEVDGRGLVDARRPLAGEER
jgi:uncharacterized membrane protein YkoI